MAASANHSDEEGPRRGFSAVSVMITGLTSLVTLYTAYDSWGFALALFVVGVIWIIAAIPMIALQSAHSFARRLLSRIMPIVDYATRFAFLFGIALILLSFLLWLLGIAQARFHDKSLARNTSTLSIEQVVFAKDLHLIGRGRSSSKRDRMRSAYFEWVRRFAIAIDDEARRPPLQPPSSSPNTNGELASRKKLMVAVESVEFGDNYSDFHAELQIKQTVGVQDCFVFLVQNDTGPWGYRPRYRQVDSIRPNETKSCHCFVPRPRAQERLLFLLVIESSEIFPDPQHILEEMVIQVR